MESVEIYLLTFLVVTGCMYQQKVNKHTFNLFAIIGVFILIIFAAGRYHVGTDINTYTNIFERYSSYDWPTFFANVDSEVLYAIIAKVTYMCGGRVLTWGTFAALITIPTYLALKKQYPGIAIEVSFFVFGFSYYTTAFNVTRQIIAVAIIFWGMQFIYKNKLLPYLIAVLIATGFHKSAVIAVVIWFLWDHKSNCPISGKRRIITIIVATVLVFFYQNALEFLSSHVTFLSTYEGYAEISTRGQNRDLYVHIIEWVIIYFLQKHMEEDKAVVMMINMLTISVLIGFTGFTHPQVKRMAYYFEMPAKLVLAGYLPYAFSERSRWLAKFMICLWFFALFVLSAYILGEANLIPYRFDLFSAW